MAIKTSAGKGLAHARSSRRVGEKWGLGEGVTGDKGREGPKPRDPG